MSGSCDERTGLLSGLSDADGLTQRKLGSPKSVPELPEDNSTPWSKRQSLRLAASLVLLSVFVLTAAKFRLLFNPARLDSMASSPTEQYPQGTPHYWVDKSDKKLEKMNQTSPLFTLANTQVNTAAAAAAQTSPGIMSESQISTGCNIARWYLEALPSILENARYPGQIHGLV